MSIEKKDQWPHDPDAKLGQRGYMGVYPCLFGKEEGIADRLRDCVRTLGTNRYLPWIGLGIIDDLLKAAEMIDGKTGKLPLTTARAEVFSALSYEARVGIARPVPVPEPEEWEKSIVPVSTEYDL